MAAIFIINLDMQFAKFFYHYFFLKGKLFKNISDSITYKTSNLIYQLFCKLCEETILGKPVRTRLSGHFFYIVHKNYDRLVFTHALELSQNFESCFKHKVDQNSHHELNTNKLINIEQLILKSRQTIELNLRYKYLPTIKIMLKQLSQGNCYSI